jgi:hypothetical protein
VETGDGVRGWLCGKWATVGSALWARVGSLGGSAQGYGFGQRSRIVRFDR